MSTSRRCVGNLDEFVFVVAFLVLTFANILVQSRVSAAALESDLSQSYGIFTGQSTKAGVNDRNQEHLRSRFDALRAFIAKHETSRPDPVAERYSARYRQSSRLRRLNSPISTRDDNSSTADIAGAAVSDDIVRKRFSMVLLKTPEDTTDDNPDSISVIANGTLASEFDSCSVDQNNESVSCYEEDVTRDRAVFQFRFAWGSNESNTYKLDAMPIVSSSGGRAVPRIFRQRYDTKTSKGSIGIKYMCAPRTNDSDLVNDTSQIRLRMPLTSSTGLDLVWKKTCGSGPLEYLEFGYMNHDKNIVLFNGDGTHGKNEEVGMEASPHDLSTQLSLHLKRPVLNLDFLAPYVTSDRPDQVALTVRGAREGGTLSLTSNTDMEISVMYECKASVSARIHVSIGIPPWKNLTASWTKDCGGGMPKSLLIGTTVGPSYDVLQEGELETPYNVSGLTAPWQARSSGIKVLDSSAHSAMFYITNVDDASEIHIQSVTVTLMPSDILFVRFEDPGIPPLIGDGYIGKTGAALKRRETKRLQLHFYCIGSGSVVVLVTLATLLFHNVEFGFVKDCLEGQVYHRSAVTAGSLMTGILLAMVLTACVVVCYRTRKKRRENIALTSLTGVGKPQGNYSLVDGEDGLE